MHLLLHSTAGLNNLVLAKMRWRRVTPYAVCHTYEQLHCANVMGWIDRIGLLSHLSSADAGDVQRVIEACILGTDMQVSLALLQVPTTGGTVPLADR